MINLLLNGQPKAVEPSLTLLALIQAMGLNPEFLVAEVNGDIIQSAQFALRLLNDQDKVELIQFVGGGQ